MSEKMVESILKNLPSELLTEEVKSEVSQLLEEAVSARVDAKLEVLKEEFETKEKELTESYALKEAELKEEMEKNERVLVEEAEKHKAELEEITIEETKQFKDRVTKEYAEESSEYRAEVEAMVLEEAKALKERQDAALVEEVKKFRQEMVEKVSDYLEAQLEQAIPEELMEAAAKLEVYEPLVEAVQAAFAGNFIKLDTTSYSLIKEARDEIATLKNQVQDYAKKEVHLKKEMKKVERNMKIEGLTEGLTAKQKSRAIKLLEGVEVDNLESRFETIRDVIIESEEVHTKKTAPKPEANVEKLEESKSTKTEANDDKTVDDSDSEIVKHQVKKVIKEATARKEVAEPKKTLPENANPLMESWAAKVQARKNRN